jgi:carbonic anhydrase
MVLEAKVVMVLGHARCGAVKSAIEGGRFPRQIGSLISNIAVAVERASRQPGSNKLETAIKSNVTHQVELLNQSAILGDLVDKKQLKIVGAYYDLDTGKIELV